MLSVNAPASWKPAGHHHHAGRAVKGQALSPPDGRCACPPPPRPGAKYQARWSTCHAITEQDRCKVPSVQVLPAGRPSRHPHCPGHSEVPRLHIRKLEDPLCRGQGPGPLRQRAERGDVQLARRHTYACHTPGRAPSAGAAGRVYPPLTATAQARRRRRAFETCRWTTPPGTATAQARRQYANHASPAGYRPVRPLPPCHHRVPSMQSGRPDDASVPCHHPDQVAKCRLFTSASWTTRRAPPPHRAGGGVTSMPVRRPDVPPMPATTRTSAECCGRLGLPGLHRHRLGCSECQVCMSGQKTTRQAPPQA